MANSRSDWLQEVVARMQELAGELACGDTNGIQRLIRAFVETLPRPTNAIDDLVLSNLLLSTGFDIVEHLHGRALERERCACDELMRRTVREMLRSRGRSAEKRGSTGDRGLDSRGSSS